MAQAGSAASVPRTFGADMPGVSLDELLAELPLEQTDLLPLSALVERLTVNAFQTLQNLSDTCVAILCGHD